MGQPGLFLTSSLVGQKIYNYLVESDLSTGGMGIVLLCRKVPNDVIVLKTCRSNDSGSLQLFRREAENWIKLPPHPNIVTAKELFTESVPDLGNRHWLILEHIAGPLLTKFTLGIDSTWQSSKPNNNFRDNIRYFQPKEILRCLLDICCGMEHISKHGIRAHGDLKPENILIDYTGRAKITDFGLSGLTNEGYHSGDYTAPEVKSGQAPDSKSDIYSFGMLVHADILPVLDNVKAHPQLRHIANKSMLLEPENRYRNLGEIARELGPLYRTIADENYQPLPLLKNAVDVHVSKVAGLNTLPNPSYDTMLPLLLISLKTTPSNPAVYAWLGYIYTNQSLFKTAIPLLKKAIRLNPQEVSSYSSLGIALINLGELDEAIANYRKAIKVNPKNFYAFNGLGEALWKQGKLDAGISACNKSIELNPRNASAYRCLGNILGDQNKLGDAIAAYRKALEIYPQDNSIVRSLNLTLEIQAIQAKLVTLKSRLYSEMSEAGEIDKAIANCKKDIESSPNNPGLNNILGNLLVKKGRFSEAKNTFKRALNILNSEIEHSEAELKLKFEIEITLKGLNS